MATVTGSTCGQCGRPHAESALVCGLCGHVLKRASATQYVEDDGPGVATTATSIMSASLRGAHTSAVDSPEYELDHRPTRARDSRFTPWIYLAIGLATAPIFALTPFLSYMGWFLTSLVHEMGHCAVAWLCGMPAIPAISLDGHAVAVHGEQRLVLAGMIWIALGLAAWKWFDGFARTIGIALVLVLYPVAAFTGARDLVHLLAGQGGELAFAALCLWKTLDGGFTSSRFERSLYGTLGWYLLGRNLWLCLGLVTSPDVRAHYAENGSFGMTNDYIRVAEDILGWRLESVAACMFLVSLLVLPAALFLWRTSSRARTAL